MIDIEQLQKKVDEIKTDLDALKKEADESVKKTKTETISDTTKNLKEEINSALSELKKDVHKNKHEIETLEDMKKSLEGFDKEVNDLKSQVEKKKSKEVKSAPSLRASLFYGGVIGKGLGSLPFIGDSIKSWAEAKVKESAEERSKEKENKEPKEKKSRWGRVLTWTGIGVGGYLAWRNWDKVKGRFGGLFESKKQKKEEKVTEDERQKIKEAISENEPENPEDEEARGEEESELTENESAISENEEETQEEITPTNDTEANNEAQRMAQEGYSDLFILVRMFELGFVPKVNYEKWRGANAKGKFNYVAQGGPFTKALDKLGPIRGHFKDRLLGNLSKERAARMHLYAVQQSAENIVSLPKTGKLPPEIEKLDAMKHDIETGKVKNFQQFKEKYDVEIKNLKLKFNPKNKFKQRIPKQIEELKKVGIEQVEKEIKQIDADINKLKADAKNKLAELDAKAKKSPQDIQKFQAEAKAMVDEHNKKILELEKKTGIKVSYLTPDEIARLSKESETVSKLMKINGGVEKFLTSTKIGKGIEKAGVKAGKIMIGVAVIDLVVRGGVGMTQGTLKQVGLEAADLGTGLVPFAGGVYDITTSIMGTGLAGDLSVTDRVIRGSIGAVSLVLDVAGLFTFGAGNAASAGVKALSRAGMTAAKTVKVVKTAKTVAEVASTGMKLGTYGFLGYAAYEGMKAVAVPIYETIDKAREEDVVLAT